jgi:HPt (histidine-containing phosphotransfer) domain-containing protein
MYPRVPANSRRNFRITIDQNICTGIMGLMDFPKLACQLDVTIDDFTELTGLFVKTAMQSLSNIDDILKEHLPERQMNRQSGQPQETWIDTIRSAAHEIKGAALNLGFMRAADLAQRMESTGSVDGKASAEASAKASTKANEEADALFEEINRIAVELRGEVNTIATHLDGAEK